jgi:cytidyltransferase-like protein
MLQRYFFILLVSVGLCSESFADEAEHKPVRIYADIVGDLFHAGDIEFFKKAKECGDYLIIGVLSDEDVESYKRVPILTLQERAAVIGACRYVDEVIVAPPLRLTREWIEEHKIDLVVHGDDFNPDLLMDQYGVSIEMGIFKAVPYTRGISTTNIIQRIVDRYHKQDLP